MQITNWSTQGKQVEQIKYLGSVLPEAVINVTNIWGSISIVKDAFRKLDKVISNRYELWVNQALLNLKKNCEFNRVALYSSYLKNSLLFVLSDNASFKGQI